MEAAGILVAWCCVWKHMKPQPKFFATLSASNIHALLVFVFRSMALGLILRWSPGNMMFIGNGNVWSLACFKVSRPRRPVEYLKCMSYVTWKTASMILLAFLDCFSWIKGLFSWRYALLDALYSTFTLQPFLFSTHSFYAVGGLKVEQTNQCWMHQDAAPTVFCTDKKHQKALNQLEPCGFVQRSGARWTYRHRPRSVARSMKGEPLRRSGRFLRGPGWRRQRFQRHKTFPWCDFRCSGVPSIHPQSDLRFYEILINNT